MKKNQITITFLCLSLLLLSCANQKDETTLPGIIPAPSYMEKMDGQFILNRPVPVFYQVDELNTTAEYLATKIQDFLNDRPDIILLGGKSSGKKGIYLTLDPSMTIQDPEGYRMVVSTKKIEISAGTPAGVFYGIQSFLQMLISDNNQGNKPLVIPTMMISDSPRFRWRGMHLDVSRHFQDKEFIKKYLDILAAHKLNVFHWHLTDDQGWRIEIEKYPGLTELAAWRVDRRDKPWDYDQEITNRKDVDLYGGFYTKEDIREIVDYATNLHITIVPEIEMPGHSQAAMTAYPNLSCSGKPYRRPKNLVFDFTDPFCAGNDSTFIFLEDVLTEVMELFPSEYIHIGGDEAKKTPWLSCPKCKALMRKENIKDVNELQSYFIRRIEKFLNDHGRKLIGWDEILEGGLAPGAAVMSWRGEEGGTSAALLGHDAVMTPWKYLYFNAPQDTSEADSEDDNNILELEEVYMYDPIPGKLEMDKQKFIIGVQACLWTENVQTSEQAEYHTLPRLCALSEIAWTNPERKNWDDFKERVKLHYNYLDWLDVNYYKP
jgi:hexosaminidase